MSRIIDFLVVGAGYSGLNALAAIKRLRPNASVLCVDRHLRPGGGWNDFYDFVRLHQPHPMFGVSGHKWNLKDPNELAPRDKVLEHFQSFVDENIPATFEFRGKTNYVSTSGGDLSTAVDSSATKTVTLQSLDTKDQYQVEARHVLVSRGINYEGHGTVQTDKKADGSTSKVEISVNDLPSVCAKKSEGKKRAFVIIGGGKTGTDSAVYLHDNKGEKDEVYLVTGQPKVFFVRETVAGSYPNSWTLPSITDNLWYIIKDYEGDNAPEVIKNLRKSGILHSLGDDETAVTFNWGVLGQDEKSKVESVCSEIIQNDYVQGYALQKGEHIVQLSSGNKLQLDHDEVFLVNCRSALHMKEESPFLRDVHPIRPDGTLDFGMLLGFPGNTSYMLTTLLLRDPAAMEKIPLYGFRSGYGKHRRIDADFVMSLTLRTLANNLSVFDYLRLSDIRSNTLDLILWSPYVRQAITVLSLLANKSTILSKAERINKRLRAGE